MYGRLKLRGTDCDHGAWLIVDENDRVIAMCGVCADATDLAAAWNVAHSAGVKSVSSSLRPQQREQDLAIMRSRGEL